MRCFCWSQVNEISKQVQVYILWLRTIQLIHRITVCNGNMSQMGTDDTPCKHIHLAKQQMDISTKLCVQFETRRGVDAFTFALVCDIWSHIFEIHWYSMTGNVWWFRFTMCFTFGKCTISIHIYGCSIYLIRKLTNRIIKAMICIQMSWNHQSWIVVCWHSLFVSIILLETVNLHLYLPLYTLYTKSRSFICSSRKELSSIFGTQFRSMTSIIDIILRHMRAHTFKKNWWYANKYLEHEKW